MCLHVARLRGPEKLACSPAESPHGSPRSWSIRSVRSTSTSPSNLRRLPNPSVPTEIDVAHGTGEHVFPLPSRGNGSMEELGSDEMRISFLGSTSKEAKELFDLSFTNTTINFPNPRHVLRRTNTPALQSFIFLDTTPMEVAPTGSLRGISSSLLEAIPPRSGPPARRCPLRSPISGPSKTAR